MPAMAASMRVEFSAERYPDLADIMTYVIGAKGADEGHGSDFEFGLDLMLDGFERLLADVKSAPT